MSRKSPRHPTALADISLRKMKGQATTPRTTPLQRTRKGWWSILVWSLASLAALILTRSSLTTPAKRVSCYPPLPSTRLEVKDSHDFIAATEAIDRFLSASALNSGIDAISAIVFTRDEGIIWGKGYGKLKGNESDDLQSEPVTIDTRFRIASISKLFTTLTSLRLQQEGVLTMQDDVRKFIPSFDPPPAGWSGTGRKGYPTTLQMLASHTSGLGRDMPNHVELPDAKMNTMTLPVVCASSVREDAHTCTATEILEAINTQPLAFVPATMPSYSNTGFNVLGWSNAAAYAQYHGKNVSLEQLLQETITGPLDLNATTFATPPPESKRYGTAVPNDTSHTDVDFGLAYNAAGGMWSTARDLGTLGTALLRAASEKGDPDFLEATTARSMMHSVVTLYDNVHSVGTPWESNKHSADREQPYMVHKKGGSLNSYTSLFQIIPELGFGAVVLQTGTDSGVGMRANMLRKIIAKVMEEKKLAAAGRLAGRYGSGDTEIDIVLEDYVLRVKDVLVKGQDILAKYRPGQKRQSSYPLWNVQNLEFRVGLGEESDDMVNGCDVAWFRFDGGLLGDSGYPFDLIYFEDDTVVYPAFNLTLERTK